MTDDNRRLALVAEWERAREALTAAKILVDAGQPVSAASRAYYALFHAARALATHLLALSAIAVGGLVGCGGDSLGGSAEGGDAELAPSALTVADAGSWTVRGFEIQGYKEVAAKLQIDNTAGTQPATARVLSVRWGTLDSRQWGIEYPELSLAPGSFVEERFDAGTCCGDAFWDDPTCDSATPSDTADIEIELELDGAPSTLALEVPRYCVYCDGDGACDYVPESPPE